jgi:hypothetical protein
VYRLTAFLSMPGMPVLQPRQRLHQRRLMIHTAQMESVRIGDGFPHLFTGLYPGVDQVFAKRFGAMRLSGCPYLTTGMDGHLTAQEWSKLLRKAVDILDARQKQLPLEKLLG